ncbi:50S ribosomal protein L25/general stress protein Ctc [Rhodococcus rhodochrous]|uniref:Large ribosomal subunit protein bL25 n=1 Tax=Rhodococcus rhodochrous TaxID=1829 RepID=A0AAW4XL45_RHORH|nr:MULTISPECIES: 50S ribosomal protein L25/general stress protein Ctc [Rhodococcus]MCD2113637.1 50S ribosomal protein L25/general stress protein Ctc [Rhodococcus rhodochrous]WAL47582.1 50S ribosomal protein L25/general stress protein Ctc [Rhodococcus pyridinivorans]
MSDENRLVASVRTEFGKGAARRARRAGQVPAVLYGHGTEPRHLALPDLEFAAVLRNHGTNAILTLDIDGEDQLALTKSVVVHPIRRYIEHADLLVVKKGEKVTVEVPVVLSGEAGSGTLVVNEVNTIKLEADALNIPEEITVSIEGAEAGTQILAGGVELPAGATLQDDPELLLVNIVEAPSADALEGTEGEEAAEEASEEA